MRKTLACFLSALLAAGGALAATATDGNGVVVSIKPLHALVQGVMGGTGEARLLVADNASPHGFSFKPSHLKALHEADVVFYIDETFEPFLHGVFETLPAHVRKNAVARAANLTVLDRRAGGAWEAHAHASHAQEAGEEAEENRNNRDPHVWLDPGNAKKIVTAVTGELGEIHPENRGVYRHNARAVTARLDALEARLERELAGVRDVPFVVFHDAYQYFEHRYGLTGVGSITLNPNLPPSVGRIREIRGKISAAGAVCVFREPQFSDRLIKAVTPAGNVKSGVLDPLGAGLENGADLYFNLLANLAENFVQCLADPESARTL